MSFGKQPYKSALLLAKELNGQPSPAHPESSRALYLGAIESIIKGLDPQATLFRQLCLPEDDDLFECFLSIVFCDGSYASISSENGYFKVTIH